VYDKLGQLIKVVDPQNGEAAPTTYTYDEVGGRLTQTDAAGRITRFQYDKLGRQTARIFADGKAETMTYDAAGSVATRVDVMGRQTTYEYDVNNRLIARIYPAIASTQNVSFDYFATGRRKTAVDVRGTTSYSYDERDRLTAVTYPDGRRVEYAWDVNGNRTALKAVVGAQEVATQYVYAEGNRLTDVVDPLNRSARYEYDGNGNRTSLSQPNGTTTEYTYDTLNRLMSLTTTAPAGTLQSYGFTLGPAGNRERIEEHGGVVRAYTYDDLYRLTGENVTIGGATFYNKSFGYDAVGNRLSQTTTGAGAAAVDYTYDGRDRLLTESAQAYAWDDNGNLTSGSGDAAYTWDLENRLVKVTKAGVIVEHGYDDDGGRVHTKVTLPTGASATTNFLLDVSGGLSHVVAETDDAGALLAAYVRGADDVISVIRPSGSGATSRWYHADGVGSIRALTDEAGNVTDTYTYTAFGEQLERMGTDQQPYAFAGEAYDPNVSFQYHRARWLDPRVGRFSSADIASGDTNVPTTLHRYVYAGANPVDYVDPTGLAFTSSFGYAVQDDLCDAYELDHPDNDIDCGRVVRQGATVGNRVWAFVKPDILDHDDLVFMEIKPLSIGGITEAVPQMGAYWAALGWMGYEPEWVWQPNPPLRIVRGKTVAAVNLGGVIFYTDVTENLRELQLLIAVEAYANRAALIRLLRMGLGTISEVGRIGRLIPVAASGGNARSVGAVMNAICIALAFGIPF
jgi:RHS repeat-associated protein